jgi:hypothetical protein
LAEVLKNQDRYGDAEAMSRQALQGLEKVLGLEHPRTLISVSNLAEVLNAQGKYEAAEELNRRALEGRMKVLGPDHPDTVKSVNHLAEVVTALAGGQRRWLSHDWFHLASRRFSGFS